jgi:hypothetical protein
MKAHKIRIKVEIVECEEPEPVSGEIVRGADGAVELVMSGEQAVSIDDCEEAVWRANYPAIREAVARHLGEVSKKKRR